MNKYDIIKDKYGYVLIDNDKKNRLKEIEENLDEYTLKIIWKKSHTHIKDYRNCLIMRENLIKGQIPKIKSIKILKSYIRISDNDEYKEKLKEKIKELKKNGGEFKEVKRREREENNLKNYRS